MNLAAERNPDNQSRTYERLRIATPPRIRAGEAASDVDEFVGLGASTCSRGSLTRKHFDDPDS
jgi:hypothetical protein